MEVNHIEYPELSGAMSMMSFNGRKRIELILAFATFTATTMTHANTNVLLELTDFLKHLEKIIQLYGNADIIPYLRYQKDNL